ncbi:hypothetical protein [Corynebacterium pseudokroppenstedtii]
MTFLLPLPTVADANDGLAASDGSFPDLYRQLSTIIDGSWGVF